MTSNNSKKKDSKPDNFVQEEETKFRHRIWIGSSVKVIAQQDLSIPTPGCDFSFKPAQSNQNEGKKRRSEDQ